MSVQKSNKPENPKDSKNPKALRNPKNLTHLHRGSYRIFFAVPFLVATLALISALLIWNQYGTFRKTYMKELEQDLSFQGRIAAELVRPPLSEGRFQKVSDFCRAYAGDPRRITVVSSSGDVVADSQFSETHPAPNHHARPEIQQVLQTRRPASAIHYSETLQVWMLYYALPMEVGDDLYVLRISMPMREISSLLGRVVWNIALALLVGAGLVTLLTFYIIFRLRLPLAKLQESAAQIAAGDVSATVFVPKKGVTRDLALAVDEMAKQLRQQIVEMATLESFRSDFVANVSHEIKTPITGILSAVETLEDGAKEMPEMRDRCLKILSHQTQRLNFLVRDILSLASLEQKQKEDVASQKFESIHPVEVLQNAVATCSEAAREAGVKLKIVRYDNPCISGDAPLLEQAVTNLIINAVRYSNSPIVELSSRQFPHFLVFSVQDFGIGIPEEHASRIFERFYRVHKERSRELGGTGLGLAIVKHISQLHRGRVEMESEVGKGSIFRILIPLPHGGGSTKKTSEF